VPTFLLRHYLGAEIVPQQKGRHGGRKRFFARDRLDGASRRRVQLGDPGILQGRNYNEEMRPPGAAQAFRARADYPM
jgi:hypothetical protein